MNAERLVLATDLDGTFAAGTPAVRRQLHAELATHPAAFLVYVTGRTPESARQLIEREHLPEPAIMIADVGTSVLRGTGPAHVAEVERELAVRWPGVERVQARLQSVPEIEPQPVAAPRRASYWIRRNRTLRRATAEGDEFDARSADDPSLSEDAAQHAQYVARRSAEALIGLEVDVLVSGNIYLDVLPRGVNKGSTLLRVLRELNASLPECIVAGDSLNDRALFEIGARGIVVGNCEPALREAVRRQPHVYVARATGAGGILEGLRHLHALPTRERLGERLDDGK